MVDLCFVPRGAEERAVRSALGDANVRIVTIGIGGRAATRAADEVLAQGRFETALVAGLCGAISSSFVVGDALVYGTIASPASNTLSLEPDLTRELARRMPGALTGIRAVDSDRIVARASDKRALGVRYGADAVDMESYALAERLMAAGVAVGVVRVASDAVGDDLPDLDRALDGSGGIDAAALALAFARAPLRAARLVANATTSLRALRRTIATLAAA